MECQYSGKYSPLAIEELGMNLPRATMLLISYNQEAYIEQALQGAIEQDYINLEIVISDDASTDLTFSKIQTFLANYNGSHKIIVNRNEQNRGVSGNLNKAISLSSGEMFFITAGDDISFSDRVSKVMDFWIKSNKKIDLIATYLFDMLENGSVHELRQLSDLSLYKSMDDWVKCPPDIVGASQAWSRSLYDQFGGLPNGVVGEDLIMTFRAVALNRAATIPLPLVLYRRGGITSKIKAGTAEFIIAALRKKNKSGIIEMTEILKNALSMDAQEAVIALIKTKLAREYYVKNIFNSEKKIAIFFSSNEVDFAFRCRCFIYAFCPWVTAPIFFFKRIKYRIVQKKIGFLQ